MEMHRLSQKSLLVANLCFFLAVGLATSSLGQIRHSLAVLATSACFALALRKGGYVQGPKAFALLLASCGVIFAVDLLIPQGLPPALLLALAGFGGLSQYFQKTGSPQPDRSEPIQSWTMALITTIGFHELLTHSPHFWMLVNSAVRAVARPVYEMYTGREIDVGPSYWAIELYVLYLVLLFRQMRGSKIRQSPFRRAFVAILPFLVTPAIIIGSGAFSEIFPSTQTGGFEKLFDAAGVPEPPSSFSSYFFPTQVLFFLPLMYAVLLAFVPQSDSVPDASPQPAPRRRLAINVGVGCLVVAVAALSFGTSAASSVRKKVVIVDPAKGLTRLPVADRPGAGFFAKLPLLLTSMGHDVSIVDKLDGVKKVSTDSVLVLTNLQKDFSAEHAAAVQSFVESGGSLLCLGDHTGAEAIRIPFNSIVSKYGIEFNFDSAKCFGDWTTALTTFGRHVRVEPVPRATTMRVSGIGTGASLSTKFPAYPVVVGKYCFSDPGEKSNASAGSLGNLKFDFGEPLGDLVLVAEATPGLGKVMVFGDTSPFQNGSVQQTFRFVHHVFRDLESKSRAPGRYPEFLIALFAFVVLWLPVRQVCRMGLICGLLILGTRAAEMTPLVQGWTDAPFAKSNVDKSVAVIDSAHHPAFTPWTYTDLGIGGIDMALTRNQVSAVFSMRGVGDLHKAGLYFLLDPYKPLTRHESQEIYDYASEGGVAIIAVSHETQTRLSHLFEKLGAHIDYEPLGQITAKAQCHGAVHEIGFVSAWPISVSLPHTAICKAWQREIIVKVPIGRGAIILVGDGRFFSEKNTEGPRAINNAKNTRFIENLIKEALHK